MGEDEIKVEMKPVKRRGLGRGLDALFGDEEGGVSGETDFSGNSPRRMVGIAQIEPNPSQPRRHYDEQALEELADSIERHGLLQPIVVRPKEGHPGVFQIVAGERRWRASQKAQLHDIPVFVVDFDDETVLEVALVENLQREDLNPLEEAEGYRRLIDQYGHTQEDIASAVGKSRSHVANIVRLLNLPETVKKLVAAGELSSGHARALVTASDPETLARQIIARGLSVRQAEALAGEAAGKTRSKAAPPEKKDADTKALEQEVSNALGMKVSINMKGKGSGALVIDFQNLDQLDEVLHRLSHFPGSRLHG